MIFDVLMGLVEIPENEKVIYRDAVRAIVLNEKNQVVMIQSRKEDLQFPGGGLEVGESELETLRREALEEAGVVIKEKVHLIGVVKEQRKSVVVEDTYFMMKSTYYLCHVKTSDINAQQLEDYEKELGLTPIEIDIAEAYRKNSTILKEQANPHLWVERDTIVLKYLLDRQEELLKMGSV